MKKLLTMLVGVLLVAFLAGCSGSLAKTANPSASSSSEPSSTTATAATASMTPPSSTNTSSQEANGAFEQAQLTQTTTQLERSDKTTDPLKLVKCSDDKVKISTAGALDLTATGTQQLEYTLSLDGAQQTRTLEFEVRDTQGPEIVLEADSVELEQGEAFDPASNVSSVTEPVDGELVWSSQLPEETGATYSQPDHVNPIYSAGWFHVDSNIDPQVPGTYQVKVRASDKYGNESSKNFEVVVKAPEPAVEEAGAAEAPAEEAEAAATTATEQDYVLNLNTGVFHHPWCPSVSKMKEENKQYYTGSRDNLGAYRSCQICNP